MPLTVTLTKLQAAAVKQLNEIGKRLCDPIEEAKYFNGRIGTVWVDANHEEVFIVLPKKIGYLSLLDEGSPPCNVDFLRGIASYVTPDGAVSNNASFCNDEIVFALKAFHLAGLFGKNIHSTLLDVAKKVDAAEQAAAELASSNIKKMQDKRRVAHLSDEAKKLGFKLVPDC